MKQLFIMITPSIPSTDVMHQMINIKDEIDGIILRFESSEEEIIDFINRLCLSFPKDKIIVHNNPKILFKCGLHRIHFKENYSNIKTFINNHPEIIVSQSVHSLSSAQQADVLGLSFILFGHIFPTPSKPGLPPRAHGLSVEITNLNIPVIALGGINSSTINKLNTNFSGVAGIRLFMNTQEFLKVKKEWLLRTTIS
ncbi:thiamine phosphate synthase [Macrococcus equi]|uniref:thiamine phosphate synthase n=1 Tax=Macrococcus equi TaxID=3395462 RepID=UPI0039BE1676